MKKQKNYFLDLFALIHANDQIVLIPIDNPKFSECFDLKPENKVIHYSDTYKWYTHNTYDYYLKNLKFEGKLYVIGVVTDNGTTLTECSTQPKENNQFHIHSNFKLFDSTYFLSDVCALLDSKLTKLESDLMIEREDDDIEFHFIKSKSEFFNVWKSLYDFKGYYIDQLNDFFKELFDNDDFEEFIQKQLKYKLFNKFTELSEKDDDKKYQEALDDLEDKCYEIERNKIIDQKSNELMDKILD
jgi:hypothetical protein